MTKNSSSALQRLIEAVKQINDRARQRRELAELSEYALHDIGLSRAQVVAETAKPAWR